MRVGEWINHYNISVVPAEERPDRPTGDVVYRVKDIWTTRDGSWEPNRDPGSLPQWARDSYLRPWGAPDYFDDAGGDHNIFARVLDLNGEPIKTTDLIIAWSDGLSELARADFVAPVTMTPKQNSGWGNQPVFNHYAPQRGESGAWCWCPRGAADVVCGGGLPDNVHVSVFAVWQAEKRGDGGNGETPVVVPEGGQGTEGGQVTGGAGPVTPPPLTDDPVEALRRAAWGKVPVTYYERSAFTHYAREQNLGAPVTEVFDVGTMRAQGFAQGIVFAEINFWSDIAHVPW